MNTYYFVGGQIRKCVEVTSEAELNGAEPCYGYGNTVLVFENGSMLFEDDCFELSWTNLKHTFMKASWRFSVRLVRLFDGLLHRNKTQDLDIF